MRPMEGTPGIGSPASERPIVWSRKMYTRKRIETGLETLVVLKEPTRGANGKQIGWFEIVARRYGQVDLGMLDNDAMKFPPTVREVIIENSKAHEAAQDKRGIKELFGTAKGQTCIIAGSGRSLLKDLGAIRSRDRGRTQVIAVNAAFKALGAENVDIVMAIDWSAKKDWWDGENLDNVKCVLGAACPPNMIEMFKNRYYFAGTLSSAMQDADKSWEKYGSLEQGFIASYTALNLAYKMGFKRVVFVGHDAAYTDMWYHHNEKITPERCEYLESYIHEDINGKMTVTDKRMYQGMQMLNAASILLEEDGVEVVNCSQEGIWASERRCDLVDALDDKPVPRLIEPDPMKTEYCLGSYVIQREVFN